MLSQIEALGGTSCGFTGSTLVPLEAAWRLGCGLLEPAEPVEPVKTYRGREKGAAHGTGTRQRGCACDLCRVFFGWVYCFDWFHWFHLFHHKKPTYFQRLGCGGPGTSGGTSHSITGSSSSPFRPRINRPKTRRHKGCVTLAEINNQVQRLVVCQFFSFERGRH